MTMHGNYASNLDQVTATGVNDHVLHPRGARQAAVSWLPDWTVHPGEILGEWASDKQIRAVQLAAMTGVPLEDIHAILRGKAPVTTELAEVLQVATGITAELWLGMQRAYDDHVGGGRRPWGTAREKADGR